MRRHLGQQTVANITAEHADFNLLTSRMVVNVCTRRHVPGNHERYMSRSNIKITSSSVEESLHDTWR
jgi:hypothetical protein